MTITRVDGLKVAENGRDLWGPGRIWADFLTCREENGRKKREGGHGKESCNEREIKRRNETNKKVLTVLSKM